jgi:aryl-alcohol dehydrogenase-like predicted oxidoreductase
MELKKLLDTELMVSPICLGTVNYDTALPKADSKYQLSHFLDMGGNFIDTAHIYGDWEPGLDARSERTIGEWLHETGNRDKLVIATKGAHPAWKALTVPRVQPKDIEKDLDESLSYLNTDYIDLYFLHRDDPKVPVSAIIDCLDAACWKGKIRYYGCSNWSLPRIKEAAAYAKSKGSKGFVVDQLMWSLADINFHNLPDKTFILMDGQTHAHHHEHHMNVMAYMSIAKGYFTRRHQGEKLPEGVTSVYDNASNDRIYDLASKIVSQGEYSFMDLSLMYIMSERKFPAIPIASFDNPAQLVEGLSCWDKPIPLDVMEEFATLKKFVYRS